MKQLSDYKVLVLDDYALQCPRLRDLLQETGFGRVNLHRIGRDCARGFLISAAVDLAAFNELQASEPSHGEWRGPVRDRQAPRRGRGANRH